MKMIFVLIFIILVLVILALFYFDSLSKLKVIKEKMINANDNITKKLHEKYELMNELYNQIKKVIKKKNYLKDFSTLVKHKLTNYELDNELAKHLETMISLKEDYKVLNNDDYNDILMKIKELDQEIIASKKYFNKNNNKLVKLLKGYNKIVAKMNNIYIKTSYEIKEPNKD